MQFKLLSDIVGTILFGPAAILSCYELAIQQGLDIAPSAETNYYPPWRMRMREMMKVLEHNGEKPFPIEKKLFRDDKEEKTVKINKIFDQITALSGGTEDNDIIESNPILRLAYSRIAEDLKAGTTYFFEDKELKLKDEFVTSDQLYRNLGHLIERLEHEIPPNAIEKSVNDRRPADLVEIINAAWFYKISCHESILDGDKKFRGNSYVWRDRLNNLTLKAIEYSDIEQDYLARNGKPEEFVWDA